jgi:hypothetical protein
MKFGQAIVAWTRVTDIYNRAIRILRGTDTGESIHRLVGGGARSIGEILIQS